MWLETAAVLTLLPVFVVGARIGGVGGDLSVSDAAVFATAGLSLFKVKLTPDLRRLLWVVAGYQAVLLLPVVHAADRASALEWVHRAELTAGAVLVGALIAVTGRSGLACRLFVLGSTVVGVAAVVALCGTQSRGAMLALVVGVELWGLATRQRAFRSPLVVALVLGMGAYVFVDVQSSEPEDQAGRQFSSLGTRVRYREQSLAIFRDEPLSGRGLKPFNDPTSGLESDPHNVVALSLAEGGLVGTAGFLLLAGGSLWLGRRWRGAIGPAAFAILGASFAHGLGDVFRVGGTGSMAWIFAGMAVGAVRGASGGGTAPVEPGPEDEVELDDARPAAVRLPVPGGASWETGPRPDVDPAARNLQGIHVVVVAYHGPDLLAEALAGVAGLPTVVVDNSSDLAVEAVAAAAGAEYVDPGRNLGFAGGVNRGLDRVPEGAHVLLLNPDARIDLDDLGRLRARLERTRPVFAAVAPAQRGLDGHRDQVTWPLPSPGRAWLEAVGLGRAIPAKPSRRFVIGSILLINGQALRDVGRFDESFFLYAEETDWQTRALAKGWAVEEVQGVTGFHVGAGTSTDERVRELRFHASQERYVRKWHGPLGWQVYRAGVVVACAARILVLGGASRRAGPRRRQCATYLRGPITTARRAGLLER